MNNPPTSWLGQTLDGRYRVEQRLGEGGMSTVYRALDQKLGRPVAVKIIHPHLTGNADFVRRFEKEASAIAQLRHPNIVQVFDFVHAAETSYIVLEYLSGETLEARLGRLAEQGQRMPAPEAVTILGQVCGAAHYAHQRGVIHRDIKPANIMLTLDGPAVLMDFGLAKMLADPLQTTAGRVIGTAAYISPEQVLHRPVDERTDVYTLGVTLYETLTGRPPFMAGSIADVLLMQLNAPVPDPRESRPDLPAPLAQAMLKSLAKDPAARFQSAEEMGKELNEAISSQRSVVSDQLKRKADH